MRGDVEVRGQVRVSQCLFQPAKSIAVGLFHHSTETVRHGRMGVAVGRRVQSTMLQRMHSRYVRYQVRDDARLKGKPDRFLLEQAQHTVDAERLDQPLASHLGRRFCVGAS
jgi:hypothetical protein